MFQDIFHQLKEKKPVIHCITNYVTANDCANLLHACGASPIMAEAAEEMEEIEAISKGLVLNMGMIRQEKIPAMLRAGKAANRLENPVVLDPVGAGISALRKNAAASLLEQIHFTAIKGNISEMKALLSGKGSGRGVDADFEMADSDSIKERIGFAKQLAKEFDTIIVITGKTDVIADARRACLVLNGHDMMGRITGSGCMLSALITAFLAAVESEAKETAGDFDAGEEKTKAFEAVVAATCMMGICGEKAFERLGVQDGNASYRNYLIDAAFCLEEKELEQFAKIEWLEDLYALQ